MTINQTNSALSPIAAVGFFARTNSSIDGRNFPIAAVQKNSVEMTPMTANYAHAS